LKPGKYKRPSQPITKPHCTYTQCLLGRTLHSLYTHTLTHTYTKRRTSHSQMETQTPHTVTRESTGLLKGTHAMEIRLIFHLVFSNKQHYLSALLQCVAECVAVLQCVAECCSALQFVIRQLVIGSLGTFVSEKKELQCDAVWCSVLQCVAVRCSVWHVNLRVNLWLIPRVFFVSESVAVCCSVLQCVAVWCSVLQCVVISHH